ncbi:MAG: cbcN [Deltaproteobacteria bacterium]|nr:cbcN [Deltaproteobacteria bacterium]
MARCATTCIAVFWLAISASLASAAEGCLTCHREYGAVFEHAMSTRAREKAFAARTVGTIDKAFFDKSCGSCHVRGCADCHEGDGRPVSRPSASRCIGCHKGYYVGADYLGMAPREDALRYQRGKTVAGETFLTMAPDVHFEAGLSCGDCHTMRSLAEGRKTAKTCTDCHRASPSVPEHRVAAHLERLECYACHSAWAAQEYGTFFLRFTESPTRADFWLKGSDSESEYLRSAYLRRQDAPPLGVNARGKVSPIRPQFIAYSTHIRRDKAEGKENRLLAAEWKAFFPHTIRRGTVLCDGCHDAPRRFLLEDPRDRIHRLREDGLGLDSFWDRTGQTIVNGGFLPPERYRNLSRRGPAYQRGYIEKWKSIVRRVDASSSR